MPTSSSSYARAKYAQYKKKKEESASNQQVQLTPGGNPILSQEDRKTKALLKFSGEGRISDQGREALDNRDQDSLSKFTPGGNFIYDDPDQRKEAALRNQKVNSPGGISDSGQAFLDSRSQSRNNNAGSNQIDPGGNNFDRGRNDRGTDNRVNDRPLGDSEREALQERIGELTVGLNSYKETSEELKMSTLKRLKEYENRQNDNYKNLQAAMADQFSLAENAIASVEDQTGREVNISGDFLNSALNIFEKKKAAGATDEEIEESLKHLAANHTVFSSRDRLQDFYNTPEGKPFMDALNELEASNGAEAGVDGGLDPEIVGPEDPVHQKTAGDFVSSFSTTTASPDVLSLLNNPKSTSEEVLAAMLMKNMEVMDDNAQRTIDFLKQQADKTKKWEEAYSRMMNEQVAQTKKLGDMQGDLIQQSLELEREKIESEKSSEMKDIHGKRSRLEGFLKAQLSIAGLLNSTTGLNSFTTNVAKFDTVISNTAEKYRLELRDVELSHQKAFFDLSTKLLEINTGYKEDYFEYMQGSDDKRSELAFEANQIANERDVSKAETLGDFVTGVLDLRQKRETAAQEAIAEANKKQQEEAERLSDDLGIVYAVRNGEVTMLTDDNGDPLLAWDRQKELYDLERKSVELTFDQEKEQFDQWEAGANISIKKALADNTITKSQHDMMIKDLDNQRKQQEFQWDKEDHVRENGYSPTGDFVSVDINGRNVVLDSGALDSAVHVDKLLGGFGGLLVASSTRDQAKTIESMANRLGFPFDAQNPSNTAKVLREAGYQVADVGHSHHETGTAIDLVPDMEYINSVKPILEANGWKQSAAQFGDYGHFIFVGGKLNDVNEWEKKEITEFLMKSFRKASGTVVSPSQVEDIQVDFFQGWSKAKAGGSTLNDYLNQIEGAPEGGLSQMRSLQAQVSQGAGVPSDDGHEGHEHEEEDDVSLDPESNSSLEKFANEIF